MVRSLLAPIHKLAQGAAGATFTSATGASTVTAGPNQYMFVMGWAYHATADPAKPTFSSISPALTWIELGDHIYSTGADPRVRMTVWYADVSAGYTSTAQFTIASTGAATVGFEACVWSDVDTSFLSNIAFGDHPTGNPTVTLATLGAGNAVWTGATGHTTFSTSIGVPTGYTSLASGTLGGQAQRHFYNLGPSSATVAYPASGNLTFTTAFALELQGIDHKFAVGSGAGAANSVATALTFTVTIASAVPAGSLMVVGVACDNLSGVDAATSGNVLSIADSGGNSYTLAAAYQNGQGLSKAGAGASLWYKVLTNPIAASGTITITTQQATVYARAAIAQEFSIGGALSVAGSTGVAADGGVDPIATVSGLTSDEYLWVGVGADEASSAPGAATGFTIAGSSATSQGGGAAANQGGALYYSIETGTTKTFTPACGGDNAAVLVAFKVVGGPTGNVGATETGADTAALTGTVAVSGSLNPTETGPDTSAITATVPIAGTFAVTEATVDTVTVNGVVVPTQGSLGVAESGSDTAALAGTLGPLPIVVSIDAQETGSDTAASSATVVVTGSPFNLIETGSDTASFPGVTVAVAGTFATTETGPDVAVINASVSVAGTFAVTEVGPDVVTADVRAIVTATLALVEIGPDTGSLTGAVPVAGTFAVTETGPDTASINVAAKVAGTFAATETGPDTTVITSTVAVAGSASIVEIGSDSAIFNAGSQAILQVSVAATETGSDVAAFTGALGALLITGSLGATEIGSDTTAINSAVSGTGTLTVSEAGADVADIIGGQEGEIAGSVVAQEIGSDVASFTGAVEVIVEAERDRLGTSVTRFEERRHKPRKRAPLAGKPLTDKQIRQLQAKVHEKRQAIWKKPEPKVVEGPVIVEPPPPSQTPTELEKARTAVSIAKVQLEYEELRKQREAELAAQQAIIERQQEAERLRREAIESELAAKEAEQERVRLEVLRKQDAERQKKAARVQEMLAGEERKLKEAEQERARVEKQNAEIARIKKTSETIAHFQKLLAEQQQRIKEVEEERIRVEALHRQNQEVMAVLLS